MRGHELVFREIRPGEYWPPVLPNGVFTAVPFGSTTAHRLLEVKDWGLSCEGVTYTWAEIQGISISGDVVCLVSTKYISGGLQFHAETCSLIDADGLRRMHINGYSVEYCLINRITFEHLRKQEGRVSRSE